MLVIIPAPILRVEGLANFHFFSPLGLHLMCRFELAEVSGLRKAGFI